MNKLLFTLRVVLVALSVSLLAGLSCVPFSASADVVLDTGPFDGQVTLTNLTFVSLEDYDSYKQSILNQITLLEGNYLVFYGQIEIADTEAYQAWLHCNQAITEFNIWIHTESSATPGNGYARRAITETNLAQGRITSTRAELDTLRSEANSVSNSIQSVKSAVESDAYLTTGTFATSAGDDSSGGCQCPDYTQILNYIDAKLGTINTTLTSINSYVQQLYGTIDRELFDFFDTWYDMWDGTYYYPIAEAAMAINSVFNHSSSDTSWGPTLGAILGGVFKTNQVASTALYWTLGELESALANSGIWQTPPLYSSDSSIASAMQQVYNPLRQLFAWDVQQHSTFYPAVGQILNFLWTRNVHPTNDISNPLMVGNDEEHPLYVYGGGSNGVLEVSLTGDYITDGSGGPGGDGGDASVRVTIGGQEGPIYVALTNAVDLSAYITNVTVQAFGSTAMNQLTNALFRVVIAKEDKDMAEDAVNTEIDIVEDGLSTQTQIEEMDNTKVLPNHSISRISQVASSASDIMDSYKDMFDSIPSDMPDPITIAPGWTFGGVSVESINWSPSNDSGGVSEWCGFIRDLFSAFWVVLYVVVLYSLAAVDICIVGICIYCVYGVLSGRYDVALHGFQWFVNLACRFLGFDPAFGGK